MSAEVVCKNCRFWRSDSGSASNGNSGLGDCRRRAPAPARSLDAFIGEAIAAAAVHLIPAENTTFISEATEAWTVVMWPRTGEDEWCGEHEVKP